MSISIRCLLSATALSTLAFLAPAHAQEGRANEQASARETTIADVIVTAQRREERLQSVPVAVTAITSDDLKRTGMTRLVDLNQIAPGLNIQQRSSYTQPTIRGVGNSAQTLGNDPNIAFYVDGAYMPTGNGSQFRFPDVSRIEVLRGPQGTLFGRNATGGLLNVVTLDPPSDAMHYKGTVSYSRFDTIETDAYVGAPLTGNIAVGVSGFYAHSDGYITDVNKPGQHPGRSTTYGLRGKLKFDTGDRFVAVLSGQYSYNDDPFPLLPGVLFDTSPAALKSPAGPAPFITVTDTPYVIANNTASSKFHEWSTIFNATYSFDNFDLISNTSYRDGHYYAYNDGDFSPYYNNKLSFDNFFHNFSEDVRVQSTGDGPFKWLLGGFAISSKDSYIDWDSSGGVAPFRAPVYVSQLFINQAYVKTVAYAAYGQLSYDLTDQLSIIGGLRYSSEKKSVLVDAIFLRQPRFQEDSVTFDDLSPKITAQYKFNDTSMAYATFGQAFKSGTFNPLQITANAANVPVKPEEITAYEGGFKTDLSRNIRLNAAVYYYDYTNIQTTINNPAGGNLLLNAAKARIKGGELEVFGNFPDAFTAGDRLRISANLAYLNAKFTDFPRAAQTIYDSVNDGVGCPLNVQVCNVIIPNAAGNRLARSPEWTGNLTVGYRLERDWGALDFDISAYFSSMFFHNEANTPEIAQPSYSKVNASISYTRPDDHVTFSLWGKNITDETQIITPYLFAGRGVGAAWYPPATYGASIKLNW